MCKKQSSGYFFKYVLKDLKDVNLNIYWVDVDIIDDLNVQFKNINDEVLDPYLSFDIFENDNLSVYSFALIETENEDGVLVVDLDDYEVVIDEIPNVYFNVYRNEYGYYVVASLYEYSNDYELVIKYIDLIGDVTNESKYVITRARKLYELLLDSNKELVSNYADFVDSEEKYEVKELVSLIEKINDPTNQATEEEI